MSRHNQFTLNAVIKCIACFSIALGALHAAIAKEIAIFPRAALVVLAMMSGWLGLGLLIVDFKVAMKIGLAFSAIVVVVLLLNYVHFLF